MSSVTNYVIPVLISMIMIMGLVKDVNVFDTFIEGAKEGFQTSIKILPALVALMAAVATFKASGALDILTHAISPVTNFIHVPEEVLPLALLRPISGSGSLAMRKRFFLSTDRDSFIGRVASVIQGSTETSFYTIAVYYGATGIKNTRHTDFFLRCRRSGQLDYELHRSAVGIRKLIRYLIKRGEFDIIIIIW